MATSTPGGQLRALADARQQLNWWQILVSGLAVLAFVGAAILGFVLATGQSSQERASSRSDCRSDINQAEQVIKDDRTNLNAAVIQELVKDLLTGTGAQNAAHLADLNQQLAVENDKVSSLPRLKDVVAHGGIIDGAHYSACPTV